ncbi:MAG: OmpA family protein [Myxococcota bacterium]
MSFALSIVVIAALSAGCGVKKEVHQKALDDLAATQNKLTKVERDRDAKAKRLSELGEELSDTEAERDRTTADKAEKEKRLAELREDMAATREELVALRKQQDETKKRLQAFRELNQRFRSLVDTGKLQVDFRKGRMVLKLPSGVLFASGKAKLSRAGEGALTEVLDILKQFKDRRFLIAGHTDNLRVRGRRFKNNWHLSTARAVSVLEFMIAAGFEPGNLGAADYGEFDPVAPNDTPENRQLNRRIEIILVPNLSELPNLTAEPS